MATASVTEETNLEIYTLIWLDMLSNVLQENINIQ
jgi:hypothetical protein